MGIKEFVKTSIKEIVGSITELQDEFKDTNVIVSPRFGVNNSKGYSPDAECYIDEIGFDLLINTIDSSEKGGSGTINVISGNMKRTSNNEEANRIKFTIPIIYPTVKFKQYFD